MHTKTETISISTLSMIKLLAIILGAWFLYKIRLILAIVFFALILSSAIDKWADKLEEKKFPRILSVLMIFIIAISFCAIIIVLIAQPIKIQLTDLISNFPYYYEKFVEGLAALTSSDIKSTLESLQHGGQLNNFKTNDIITFFSNIFGGITSLFLILVLTFYMSIHEHALKKAATYLLKKKYYAFSNRLISKIQDKIGAWLAGQLILSFIVGLIVYIGLSIIGIKYALILGIIAGLGEFIPYIGPIIASLMAMILALSFSPLHVIIVAIFYGALQLVENHILVPKIMQQAVGLNPIINICAILIGIKIGGFMGALIALPTAIVALIIIDELTHHKDSLKT